MAVTQTIDVAVSEDGTAAGVLARYGHLVGHAFEAAIRYEAMPVGTPLSVATIRELLGVGCHVARRVLRELIAGGLAAGRRIKDGVTGRMVGRRTDWLGPRKAGGDADAGVGAPAAVDDRAGGSSGGRVVDLDEQALVLLLSLGEVDARLAFRERDLRTLVPFVVDRLAAGDTVAGLRRMLTRDLPRGRGLRTGLLHHRLTKNGRGASVGGAPAATLPGPRVPACLVECGDCGRPNRDLTPGDLCRDCRGASDPLPVAAVALPARLADRMRRTGPTGPGDRARLPD